MEGSSPDWNFGYTIAIIGILIGTVLTCVIGWNEIYPKLFARKYRKNIALKELRRLKKAFVDDLEQQAPFKLGYIKEPKVSQEIVSKLAGSFSNWLADNNIQSDANYSYLICAIGELENNIRNVRNPIRKQGAMDSEQFEKAVLEIQKILEQIEKQLVEKI